MLLRYNTLTRCQKGYLGIFQQSPDKKGQYVTTQGRTITGCYKKRDFTDTPLILCLSAGIEQRHALNTGLIEAVRQIADL